MKSEHNPSDTGTRKEKTHNPGNLTCRKKPNCLPGLWSPGTQIRQPRRNGSAGGPKKKKNWGAGVGAGSWGEWDEGREGRPMIDQGWEEQWVTWSLRPGPCGGGAKDSPLPAGPTF